MTQVASIGRTASGEKVANGGGTRIIYSSINRPIVARKNYLCYSLFVLLLPPLCGANPILFFVIFVNFMPLW
jgi:hypothetical protein